MAVTLQQLESLGFKHTKMAKGMSSKKYDTLIYPLNKTDYIFTGYNRFKKAVDFKMLWKCFNDPETGETITYPLSKIGELSYTNVKEYLEFSIRTAELKKEVYE